MGWGGGESRKEGEKGGLKNKYSIMVFLSMFYGLFVCHYALGGSIKTLNDSESLESELWMQRVLRN